MKKLFVIFWLLYCSTSIAGKLIKLPSGEEIEITGVEHAYAAGANEWVYALHYLADDLSNMDLLCERANYLWPLIEPKVESKGWSYASVRAKKVKEKSSLLLFGSKTIHDVYSIGFKKNEYGKWINSSEECRGNKE